MTVIVFTVMELAVDCCEAAVSMPESVGILDHEAQWFAEF